MKLALVSIPIAASLFFAGAHAQFASYGIPSCATPCVEQAAIQGRCGFTDTTCICTALKSPAVLGTAVMCELGGCPDANTGGETGVQSALVQFFDGHCMG